MSSSGVMYCLGTSMRSRTAIFLRWSPKMPVMGLMKKGGRTPVSRVTLSQRSQASRTWAMLKTSVTMTWLPSATRVSRASSPGAVAGILGVALGAMVRAARASSRMLGSLGVGLGCPLDGDEALAPAALLVERSEALTDTTDQLVLDVRGHDFVVVAIGEASADDGQDLVRRALDEVAAVGRVGRAAHGTVLEREVHLLDGRVVDPEPPAGPGANPLEVVLAHLRLPSHDRCVGDWWDGMPPVQWRSDDLAARPEPGADLNPGPPPLPPGPWAVPARAPGSARVQLLPHRRGRRYR